MKGKISIENVLSRASDKRIYLDTLFFLILLLLTIFLTGKRNRLFGVLVCIFTFIYSYNGVTIQQFFEKKVFDEHREQLEVENTTTNLQLPSAARLGLHVPLIISGFIQTVNRARKDETYALTRDLGASLIAHVPERVVYRPISHPLPRKIIYLMQHVTAVLDNFTFLQFIPEGYRFRVLNRSDANPLGLFPKSSRKNLFGAHFLEMGTKEDLKKSVCEFVNYMVTDTDPTVYCIWPTGRLWEKHLENGIQEFKLGAFYMSCFTKIPVTVIHTKIHGFVQRVFVEQSPLFPPPRIQSLESEYIQFYENPAHKPIVTAFRDKIENVYREMDNRLSLEISG